MAAPCMSDAGQRAAGSNTVWGWAASLEIKHQTSHLCGWLQSCQQRLWHRHSHRHILPTQHRAGCEAPQLECCGSAGCSGLHCLWPQRLHTSQLGRHCPSRWRRAALHCLGWWRATSDGVGGGRRATPGCVGGWRGSGLCHLAWRRRAGLAQRRWRGGSSGRREVAYTPQRDGCTSQSFLPGAELQRAHGGWFGGSCHVQVTPRAGPAALHAE